MDWLKTTLDRLFVFLASLIPGCACFLLLLLHRPDLISYIWNAQVLSYETKLIISVFLTFVMGWTATYALNALLMETGSILARWLPTTQEPAAKPWQNKNWRALLMRYLGKAAPKNVEPVYDEVLKLQLEALQHAPAEERVRQAAALFKGKAESELNDHEWRGWWEHFHYTSFQRIEPVPLMMQTVAHNFYAASLLMLFAMPFTPQLRIWWLIAFCVFWLVHLIAKSANDISRAQNPWSSWTEQMEHLQLKLPRDDNCKPVDGSPE